MKDIKCPYDLNQFILGEPMFENTFPEEECEQRKFYGDCHHCFSTAIAKRDYQLRDGVIKRLQADNLSCECMVKYTGTVESQESEE